MSDTDFSKPQRQSLVGVVLIFVATFYKLLRNFWALGLYFFVLKANDETILYGSLALIFIAILTLVYSFFYYLKFTFFINEKNKEFVLQKGVFSSDVVNIPFHKIQQVNFKRNILQRIIGIYSVVIDTAGSGEEEVEIKALSRERADELAALLMEFSAKENISDSVENENVEVSEPKKQWEYRLDIKTLLKLGLTSNYFRGLAILVAFYSTLRTQFGMNKEFLESIPIPEFSEFVFSLLMILFLLIIVVLVTVAETFIKYFRLNISRKSNALQVEMGLRSNTKVNLKASRVQLLQEIVNPVQKKLNLYKLKISLASSQDAIEKNQISIPGLPLDVVGKVKEYLYTSTLREGFVINPDKLLLIRKILWSVLPLTVILIGVLIYVDFEVPTYFIGIPSMIFICFVAVYQFFAFKKIALFVSEDFLILHSGLWNRRKKIIEMYKLQSVSLENPLWYKRRKLVNITFHSAGGDINFPVIQKAEAITLVNYLLYKIESTDKNWM